MQPNKIWNTSKLFF